MSTQVQLSPEVEAIAQLEATLGALDDAVKVRVLRWALERFGLHDLSSAMRQERQTSSERETNRENGGAESAVDLSRAGTLSEFYAAVSPSTDAEKVLIAGYWFQFREGVEHLEAHKINSELKHLGHKVGNITRAFDALISQKPQLVVQLKKEGKTKQARKKYKLTNSGKLSVEAMLKGGVR